MKRTKIGLIAWLVGAVTCAFVTSAMASQPLVDVAWIKENSCDPNIRVLDIRNKWDGSRKGTIRKGIFPVRSTRIIHLLAGVPKWITRLARCRPLENWKN